jgi:hypothetical protein
MSQTFDDFTGLFGSSVEAEFSACRTACIELDLLSGRFLQGVNKYFW